MAGRRSPAEAAFRQALALERAGEAKAALDAYLGALVLDPGHARSHYQIAALAHRAGDLAMAERFFARAAEAEPTFAAAFYSLGLTRRALGRAAEAQGDLRTAVALDPAVAEAQLALGAVLHEAGRLDEAALALDAALALRPAYAEAWMNLGNIRREQRRPTEAAACAERATALAPGLAPAWRNLAVIRRDQGLIAEACAAFDRALGLAPQDERLQSERLFCLNYHPGLSAAEVAAEHRRWGEAAGRRIPPSPAAWPPIGPGRRLRVGYVSGDLHSHPVGWFLAQVLEGHDRAAFEVFAYANSGRDDAMTARLRAAIEHWRVIAGRPDDVVEAQIRADGIDLLIDLSGHAPDNRLGLFARRCAPAQAAWLGYVSSTGLAAVDHVILDPWTAPPGAEPLFVETIVRLPQGRFCYAPPAHAPPVAQPPSAAGHPFTFGSFNDLAKVGPEVVRLWAQVLRAVPGSRLRLKWLSLDDAGVCARLTEAFAAEGVGAERLQLRGYSPHAEMLADYAKIDLALDPFPFGGGLTSCEALWMGVPVVTLPGAAPASRQTLAFLGVLGLEALAADSPATYRAIAAGLAADPPRLAELRAGLRARMRASALCDAARFVPDLEDAYRRMVGATRAR